MYDQSETTPIFDPKNNNQGTSVTQQNEDSSIKFQDQNHGINSTIIHTLMLPNNNNTPVYDQTNPNPWGPQTNMTSFSTHHYNHETINMQVQPTNTTDLLTLLQLPKFSLGFLGEVNPAMIVDNPSGSGSPSPTISYDLTSGPTLSFDQGFQPNFALQFDGYGRLGNGNGNANGDGKENSSCLFGGFDDGEGNTINGFYHEEFQHYILGNNSGVFEFGKGNGNAKVDKSPKSSFTEKQRRRNFNDKYNDLRSLIPNQTKDDKASIVLDAINHIHELKRIVEELKLLVAKKKMTRQKIDQDDTPGGANHQGNTSNLDGCEVVVKLDSDEDFKGSASIQLRSSWIQRKSKDTEVDVRIVDDDVTIKLSQRKKNTNYLLFVSRTFDELGLDLRHVAGGRVGDYYSYLFNSKICEGSSVYASAIANKVIEVVERQHVVASVNVGQIITTF